MDALQGVDLEIQPGELVALLGPNGAGKTTSVSIRPNLPSARRPVGVTLQESGFLDNLTVAEMVDLVRVHWPDPAPTGDLLDRFGLVTCRSRSRLGWPPTSDELHDARDQGESGHSD